MECEQRGKTCFKATNINTQKLLNYSALWAFKEEQRKRPYMWIVPLLINVFSCCTNWNLEFSDSDFTWATHLTALFTVLSHIIRASCAFLFSYPFSTVLADVFTFFSVSFKAKVTKTFQFTTPSVLICDIQIPCCPSFETLVCVSVEFRPNFPHLLFETIKQNKTFLLIPYLHALH